MRILILTFYLFQNNQHVNDMIKDTFDFQNTNTDLQNQIRIHGKRQIRFFKTQIRF